MDFLLTPNAFIVPLLLIPAFFGEDEEDEGFCEE
tara:strand:+ start:109 stop:210 length:102 start_codon:yes stop_codon:yes gene_type:complete